MPRGLRQRATSGRDLLSLDSTSPSCQEGSRLAKEHKASVPSGLLGIFSAKSPISPEQNPEVGRPGGGGGESCCSTAATPWCSVTGSCSPWHQDLCRRVLASLICSQNTFSFASFPSAPTKPCWPSTSLSWWPACKCPPDCHCPSCWDQIGCLHYPLAFYHQRCFFHLHTSPSAQFGLLPRLAAAKEEPVSMVSFLSTHAASLLTRPPQKVLWPEAV